MNKILCGVFALLLAVIIFLSVSFAAPDTQNEVPPTQPFEEMQIVPYSKNVLDQTSQGINEISVTAILPDYPWILVSGYRGYLVEKCVSCHKGISQIGKSHPLSFGCTVCHGGDGNAEAKEAAHSTLIYDPEAGTGKRNPSPFSSGRPSHAHQAPQLRFARATTHTYRSK